MSVQELSQIKSHIEQLISIYNEGVGEAGYKLEFSTESI